MTVAITLNLPESLVEQAQRFGQIINQDVGYILADTLEMIWPMIEELPDTSRYPSVSTLSDSEILALADSKMDEFQNERLGYLQNKGKTTGLTEFERYELLALLQIYQLGQLRKSEAMAEAVERGLRTPLSA